MLDIVSAENLPCARGIKANAAAGAMKNFRQPKSADEAKTLARTKNILLYSPSYEFDEGIYKDLKKGGGAIAFSFSDACNESGFRRGITLSKMRLSFESCRRSGCGFLVCTLANEKNALRNAKELESFMAVLGMNQHEKAFAEKKAEMLVGI